MIALALAIVATYVVIWVIAAVALYSFAVMDHSLDPASAAVAVGAFWPVLVLMAIGRLPFWLLTRFVLLVNRKRSS